MTDEFFEQLCSKMITEEWISVNELDEIIRRRGLGKEEMKDLLVFLKKYFIQVDESTQKARLNPWARRLFEVSMS